jgi:hypothetical protein
MFRYVRYNPLSLIRPVPKRNAETSESIDGVEARMPRRAMRLGTLDPETSKIIWRDELGEEIATAASPSPSATDELAPS